MERYSGTCERLCDVDPSPIRDWLKLVPFESWPQQDRLNAESPYPSMLTDRRLAGYYATTQPLVDDLMTHYPGGTAWDRRISVVMPGQKVFRHTDKQESQWRVRIHVPVNTNPQAIMFILDRPYHMDIGGAYIVNTEVEHHLHNLGSEPRIHFFFDVRESA